MSYDIFKRTVPAMPKPSKGTEFVKLMLSQASNDMKTVLVPMALPAISARMTGVKAKYSDNKFYELCGQMGYLIGPSGIGKAQLTLLIEAIMRQAREHDDLEYKKFEDKGVHPNPSPAGRAYNSFGPQTGDFPLRVAFQS